MRILLGLLTILAVVSQAHATDVTTLADSGPGSLRACVAVEGAYCEFTVAGRIILKDALRITKAGVTVDGENAPEPGILLTNSGVSIEAPDVTIRHIAIGPGDGPSLQKPADRDALKVRSAGKRAHIEHVSMWWGVDEDFSCTDAKDVLVEDSIIAEGLHLSIHTDPDPGRKGHSMGALINGGCTNMVFRHVLFAFNRNRNPQCSMGSECTIDGNVIAAWGDSTQPSYWNTVNVTDLTMNATKPVKINVVNNTFIPGSGSGIGWTVYGEKVSPNTRVYISGNVDAPYGRTNLPSVNISSVPLPPFTAPTLTALEAREYVFAFAGSRPWARNPVDTRIISEVLAGTGSLKNTVAEAGGYDQFVVPVASPTPESSPTPTPTSTPTATSTATITPTSTFTPTALPTITPEPTATAVPTATSTSIPEPTATRAATPTKTVVPTKTATPVRTPTAEPTATPLYDQVTVTAGDGDDVVFRVNGLEVLRFTRSERLNIKGERADIDARTARSLREFLRARRDYLK